MAEDVRDWVDDLVEAWHNGDGEGLALHEFLGMTWEQYDAWVKDPSTWPPPCAACGQRLRGFSSIWTQATGQLFFCHPDDDSEPSCYERAQWKQVQSRLVEWPVP